MRDENLELGERMRAADVMLKRGLLFALIGMLGSQMTMQSQAELQRAKDMIVGAVRGRG